MIFTIIFNHNIMDVIPVSVVIFQNLSRDEVAVIENPVAVRQSFHAQQLQVDDSGQNNPTWSREFQFLHPGKSKLQHTLKKLEI